MSDEIEFCDPPRRGTIDQHDWDLIESTLVDRPGEWARVAWFDKSSPASTMVRAVKSGAAPIPAGEYEAKSRKVGDRIGVWMRRTKK